MPIAAPVATSNPPDIIPGGYSIVGYGAYADTITYSTDTIGTPVYVNIASASPLNVPVTVTLALDTAALDSFNVSEGGVFSGYTTQVSYGPNYAPAGWLYSQYPVSGYLYEMLPTDAYSVASWTVTVPAGQRLAPLWVTINPSKIDTTTVAAVDQGGNPTRIFNHNYVLPITIATASQKVSNYNTVLVNVQVTSQYEHP